MNRSFENIAKPETEHVFQFRAGTADDLKNMALLTERAYAESRGRISQDTASFDSADHKELQERARYNGYWSILAFDGEKLAGFASGYPGDWKGEDDGTNSEYLYLLMVDPVYQGDGLGRKLLKDVASAAKKKDRKSLVLWVPDGSENAKHLYRDEGFRATEQDTSERHGKVVRYQLDLK